MRHGGIGLNYEWEKFLGGGGVCCIQPPPSSNAHNFALCNCLALLAWRPALDGEATGLEEEEDRKRGREAGAANCCGLVRRCL